MMPPLRGLLNSSSDVFLTVPMDVAMNTNWSEGKLREGPVSGNRGCVRRVAGGQFRETRLSPSADRESLPDLVGVEGIETDVVLDVLLQLDLQHGASWKRAWLLRSQAARLFWWFD